MLGRRGPTLALQQALASEGLDVRFTLTDRFPNKDAFERTAAAAPGAIQVAAELVDALAVPKHLRGFRRDEGRRGERRDGFSQEAIQAQ